MIKWFKKKVLLWFVKRALNKLRDSTKQETIAIATILETVASTMKEFARGEIEAGKVFEYIQDAIENTQEIIARIKKWKNKDGK